MIIKWNRNNLFLTVDEVAIDCWCKVRNELNNLRPLPGKADLAWSIGPYGEKRGPVMPRIFPVGEWEITQINPHPDKVQDGYLYPFFIMTNAHKPVEIWELDERGFYKRPTGKFVEDYYDGLHYSNDEWTQGCIRIAEEKDLRWMVSVIQPILDDKEKIPFIVTEE